MGDSDLSLADTSEQVIISSLALIKMLRHGRAGVPMEVMGLMLGEFVDDYTIKVVDVFSMPQSGNTVSVEAVDPVYQAEMLDMLKRTARPEMVVGWYHSHPGFGCWFSGTDINTQQSFEQLNSRAVGVVVDPVQSVKGVVVIDCFRLINPHLLMLSQEPRQTTSNVGHLTKPAITALIHGLNKHYYSLVISYRKSQLEQNVLLGLMQSKWTDCLKLKVFNTLFCLFLRTFVSCPTCRYLHELSSFQPCRYSLCAVLYSKTLRDQSHVLVAWKELIEQKTHVCVFHCSLMIHSRKKWKRTWRL